MADFDLVEKDVLCAIMTIIAGVDSGSYEVSLECFLLILYHVASKNETNNTCLYSPPLILSNSMEVLFEISD